MVHGRGLWRDLRARTCHEQGQVMHFCYAFVERMILSPLFFYDRIWLKSERRILMNRISRVFIALSLVLGVSVVCVCPSFSASLSGIGFIDVQKVFKGYSETEKAQAQISKEEETFKKDFDASQKKLEEAKTAKKPDKEIEELAKKLETDLAPKREKLVQLNTSLNQTLQKSIVSAVKEVSKNLGIDIVLDKQVVINGGTDISDMVINKLNEKK
jgi:Skp family chaperone for outer membrane proteins